MKLLPMFTLILGVFGGVMIETLSTSSAPVKVEKPAEVPDAAVPGQPDPAIHEEPGPDSVPAEPSAVDPLRAASTFLRTRSSVAAPMASAGSIAGRVLQPNGEPVAGVRVRAASESNRARRSLPNPDESDLETYLSGVVARRAEQSTRLVAATTDSEGRFSVDVGAHTYRVTGAIDGYRVDSKEGCRAGDGGLELTAQPMAKVEFRVFGADGRPWTEKLLVRWNEPGTTRRRGRTSWTPDKDPTDIEPGEYEAVIQDDTKVCDPVPFRAIVGEKIVVDLRLRLAGRLRVKVQIPEEVVRADFKVLLLAQREADSTPNLVDLAASSTSKRLHVVTPSTLARMSPAERERNDPPRVTFEAVDPGLHLVGILRSSSNSDLLAHQLVEVVAGATTEHILSVPSPPKERTMTVELISPTGQILTSARDLRFDSRSKARGGIVPFLVRDGLFRLELDEDIVENVLRENNSNGWRLKIQSEKHGLAESTFVPGGHVSIQLEETADVEITITQGLPPDAEARLVLRGPGTANDYFWGDVRANRVAKIENLAAGRYQVIANLSNSMFPLGKLDVVVPWTRHSVVLPDFVQLQLPVDGDPESQVSYRSYWLDDESLVALRTGTSIESLPATPWRPVSNTGRMKLEEGRHRIHRASPDGDEVMEVELTSANPSLEWDGDPLGGFEVWTVNEAVLALGFQSGDALVAIQGVELRSQRQFLQLLSVAREAESVELRVKRGGSSISLVGSLSEVDNLAAAPNTRWIPVALETEPEPK